RPFIGVPCHRRAADCCGENSTSKEEWNKELGTRHREQHNQRLLFTPPSQPVGAGYVLEYHRAMLQLSAEIVTIGDELCRGEIADTNSQFLAEELWNLGIATSWMTSCRDQRQDIVSAARLALARADLVLVSGGLGPTSDDVTVDALAELLGVDPITDDDSLARIRERVARWGRRPTASDERQARLPRGAEPLPNPVGAAPGFVVVVGEEAHGSPSGSPQNRVEPSPATIICLPGVPTELRALWTEAVAPRIALMPGRVPHERRVLRVFGLGESIVGERLIGLADSVPGATLHYQAVCPEILVEIVVVDACRDAAAEKANALEREARARLGSASYGSGSDSLALVLGRRLHESKATLALAESCTGGMIGSLITGVPGSSRYFLGGYITYANEAKQRDLGVSAATLAHFGAVSQECALEMARGTLARSGATIAAAVSGIAGPEGGTPEKPVGTVHLAVVSATGKECHRHYILPGDRDAVRKRAAYWTMYTILNEL
ncbi:MAG: CinA family nicotinamide mononucleotide deamidase-related protein, partial [Pseudomonadota bacterium]